MIFSFALAILMLQQDHEYFRIYNFLISRIPFSETIPLIVRFKLKPNLASSLSIDLAVVAILKNQGKDNRDAYLIAAKDES